MYHCPVEILTKIFSFACTDGGYTGRSLSLVSTHFHDASLPVKFQSIILRGFDQTKAFCTFIQSSPFPARSRVQHLLVVHGKKKRPLPVGQDWESLSISDLVHVLETYQLPPLIEREKLSRIRNEPWLKAATIQRTENFYSDVQSILRLLADELETLSLVLPASADIPSLLSSVRLPSLLEFTVVGGMFPIISPTTQESRDADKQPIFPSVQYLHILGGVDHGVLLVENSPSLTHLRVSDIGAMPADLTAAIESLLQQPQPDSPLSTTIEKILLQPTRMAITSVGRLMGAFPNGRTGMGWIDLCRNLDKGNSLVLLPPDSHTPGSARTHGQTNLPESAEAFWRDRVEGKVGCWQEPAEVHSSARAFPFKATLV